jgi:type IV pilus assembly protein PilW
MAVSPSFQLPNGDATMIYLSLKTNPGRLHQSGFGLIEMMISILIAMLLMLGIGSIFYTQRFTYASQTGLSKLQETERQVIALFANVGQSAGYYPNPQSITRATALPAVGTVYGAGQYVSGTTGTGGASDTLRIRYQTANGDGILNCLGNSNNSGGNQVFDNIFAITTINGVNVLTCQISVDGGAPAAAVPLVDGIQSMSVSYGMDSNGKGSATQYVVPAAITDWTKVVSIKITLTFNNPLYNTKGGNNAGQQPTLSMTQVVRLMNYAI